ncbi:DUF3107 domain-containing protein [Occultella glacieicola]|uniref:DUF3107 domain-containing protein n=1 Tax=Occultella glacieicola TaxID=2518684 RepID=A0ABY2ECF0_9MICO|nr:DUF3107 domain-containing protein [Occultella glacieicola]TDE97509.1 DUF3107 domain-containing protein [Occultella glacieicola]
MEITIGIKNVARELSLEVSEDGDAVVAAINAAIAKAADGENGGVLDLTDTKGRRVVVPVAALGYVEIGADEPRRVGFGTL